MNKTQNSDLAYHVESIANELGHIGNELSNLRIAIEAATKQHTEDLRDLAGDIDMVTGALHEINQSDFNAHSLRDSLANVSYFLQEEWKLRKAEKV